MVGRTPELETLVAAFKSAAAGTPQVLLIRGEAGIGKSRIIREFLESSSRELTGPPVVTAVAHCVNLGPIGTPFAPVRHLIRDVHTAVGDDSFRAAAGGPQVLTNLGILTPVAAQGADAIIDDGADRLAEAVERIIEGLSRDFHLVLVIEDMHWADDATLALVRTLSTTMRADHLTLVLNYRNEDVGRGHPLRAVLSELERNRAITAMTLGRLDRDEIADQSRQILGRRPTADELDTLVQRSGGVPFYVEELLGIPENELPDSLRDVVLARFERLDEGARRVVEVAAVGGLSVSHDVLADAWNGSEADLMIGLRSAITAGIITTEGDSYGFRHALIHEAVYEDLLPHARSQLHAVFGRNLQARVDTGDLSQAGAAAEHWLAAHEDGPAFDALVVARLEARRAAAPETSAAIGERLLELWPRVQGAQARASIAPLQLRLEIARDLQSAHRVRACLRVIDEALQLVGDDDVEMRIEFLFLEMRVGSETERHPNWPDRLDEIDRLLGDRTDQAAVVHRARAMARRASFDRDHNSRVIAASAVELARESGDPTLLSEALYCLSRVRTDLRDSHRDLTEALSLTPVPSQQGLMVANNLVCVHLMMGLFPQAIELGMGAYEAATAAGRERGGAHVLSNTAEAFIASGRLEEGIVAARRAVGLTRGDSEQVLLNAIQIEALGLVWNDEVQAGEALMATESDGAAAAALDLQWIGVWNMVFVDAAVARAADARTSERIAILAEAVPYLEPLNRTEAANAPFDLDTLLVSGASMLAAARLAGLEVDAAHSKNIRALTGGLPDDPWFVPLKALVAAHLITATTGVPSAAAWSDALREVSGGRVPLRHLHHARFRLAEALLGDGERAEAIALLRQVAAEAPGDAVSLVGRWAAERLARLGRNPSADEGPLGTLTSREREVLALVAEGLTNGEIGTRLFISTKTASVHVSAILAKLGAANRAEAASVYTASAALKP